ncbi:CdaR family protein [Segatella copri]|uniref:CdaR family protein n=1 Tax=Segatella copri TaxID=165179 RepID=UPI001C439F86|nr:CdaR family protein [Segatella copri]WOZ83919.1 CdaR family protein [Segatella copri]
MRSVRNILKAVRNFLFSGLNKEFLIFLFFLALSGAFWLLMTLNETMEREFKIPMRLTGVPGNAVITGELPDTVRVTVRDKGFTLVTYDFRPLVFRFSNYADEDEGKGVIPLTDVQKQVLSQMYGSSKLLQVKPGAFDFYFTYGTSKKVPVVFRGKITTSKSYYLAHTEFYPSIVTVYANKQQLDKLQTVEIEPFNYRNLQDTIRQAVKIRKIRGVKIVPSTVRLSVYPDVLTEEAIEVPITAINMPPGMVLRTFPSKVTVRFTIGASLFRTIKPNLFKVVVDYEELAANPSDKCTLQLRSVPRSVSKASLEIDRVDYLLEQQ